MSSSIHSTAVSGIRTKQASSINALHRGNVANGVNHGTDAEAGSEKRKKGQQPEDCWPLSNSRERERSF
ncbi:hypothetical protein CEE69_00195 [Rhodopirellula bahusiensis]|uniref:Uncharacterized protein n=1 Tax=Rhodopirellula bahusiensis TaxID=2014065 RepID=A0A2G1WCY2_9BACT|nr:hypothetical protein CEE69_00195 [Rhodopirellula bahusiensis]